MARSRYEYGTSPRKSQPEYNPRKREKKNNLKVVKDLPRQEVKMTKEQIKRRKNIALIVVTIFVVLLTVSYRNSQINEKFSQVQKLKKELSSIQKENEQLKVNIENSLNLNNVEKIAKEKLGMQKLINRQTLYVSLPKRDYVEAASEEVKKEEDKNWLQKMVESLFNK